MLIPVRCFSCGKPISHLYREFQEKIMKGEKPKKALDELGLKRQCCRATMLGTVDMMKTISEYRKR